ncbi:ATP-dependent protease subunit HslV [Acidobacteria bacterium AH-259-A15]|nr:ATP-dependent protease subunit HslV [Acidobacteria bacterium AH-259-A15]
MAALRGTTILLVRRGSQVALAGDGQVSLEDTIIKATARKIRRLHDDQVLAGFAGSTADAFSLFARFESKLEEFHGNLPRAAVELAKEWRTDKVLRHLHALLVVSDKANSFLVSGDGDLIEPDDGLIAVGSGGPYALAAARALLKFTKKSAPEIAEESLKIAGEICVYTNTCITVESL